MREGLLKFVFQSLKSPASIGSIWPSSRALATKMLDPIDFSKVTSIIEIGPGSGAITSVIAERLVHPTQYIGIELNNAFYKMMVKRFPALHFVKGDAEDLGAIMASLNLPLVDVIICSLPWAVFDEDQQKHLLNRVHDALMPGSLFITYAYLQGFALPQAWALRRLLKERFSVVKTTKTIWNNLPPAFAYVCTR